ncbi:hypothetical protein MRB53_034950 [Persea americana]|uniref:Uncharacterized protein n=1 Tax=Persea americana TaxID=3435 RepID=A0ACC2K395_PERAE|nr:hypothetical protein MRB53_034950 [Persea americana]
MKCKFPSRVFSSNIQKCTSTSRQCYRNLLSDLLDRRWALLTPESKINKIVVSKMKEQHKCVEPIAFSFSNNMWPSLVDDMMEKSKQELSFYVVRDDLLHPLVNGNKARKLDALLPLVEDHSVTDVVTCGGCQSAHAAAVAVSCAERGLSSHLLLRGERPEIPTGYNLISEMYGNVTYIARSLYAKREEMLTTHAALVAGSSGSVLLLSDILDTSPACKSEDILWDSRRSPSSQATAEKDLRKVVIINEGAGNAKGLLGVIRLVKYLSQNHLFGKERPINVVVDAGTGTTAVGLGIGALLLGLPWEITAVMLADNIEGYKKQEEHLKFDFKKLFGLEHFDKALNGAGGDLVDWVERLHPRKFGNVLKGEVEVCQQIARQTGILVDPVYTLAAWEHATFLCQREAKAGRDAKVVMLHTGGTLGMFGLAQRPLSYYLLSQL